uniref:Ribosome biogenesis protein NOP53 n=1 Tax=Angiostrongylus cantonensis TaxID=6313 RepID=A0A0K0D0D6_ANGCA
LSKKVKRKRTKSEVQRDEVKRILSAASKGQVELPPDEGFIVEEWGQPATSGLSDKLAAQGFSLVEQVRAGRPTDLMKRNLRYVHYMDKKRKLDTEKAKKIVMEHLRKKDTKEIVRKERDKITCELF